MTVILKVVLLSEESRFRCRVFLHVRKSLSCLEELFACLCKHQLVSGAPGPSGGYLLRKDAGCIAVGEVTSAISESVEVVCYQGNRWLPGRG